MNDKTLNAIMTKNPDDFNITVKEFSSDGFLVYEGCSSTGSDATPEQKKEMLLEILEAYDWDVEIFIKATHNLTKWEYDNDV